MTTVPEAVAILRSYYAMPGREFGGAVHLITEDGNYEQRFADSCLTDIEEWASEHGGGLLAADVEVAEMLQGMSNTQRKKLSKMNFYPERSSWMS
jgi:hypothetical protein